VAKKLKSFIPKDKDKIHRKEIKSSKRRKRKMLLDFL
jgi:hypothetical protein